MTPCETVPLGKIPYSSMDSLEEQQQRLRAKVCYSYRAWPVCQNDMNVQLEVKYQLVKATANPYIEGWLECPNPECQKGATKVVLW